MRTLSNISYWVLLCASLVMIFGSGFSTLFFNTSEDITFPIFVIGVMVLFLTFIPAKLEELRTVNV